MDRVAYDFARDMMTLLPNEPPRPSISGPQREWCKQLPSLDVWYQPPRVLMNAPTYKLAIVPPLEEWDG